MGVSSVKTAIEAGLSDKGREILGGDAELRLTYRRADPAEMDRVRAASRRVSEIVDFRSMAVAKSRISGKVARASARHVRAQIGGGGRSLPVAL